MQSLLIAGFLSFGMTAYAAPGDIRCFGMEGGPSAAIHKTVELKANPLPSMPAVEFTGQGDSYMFNARVFKGESVFLAIFAQGQPVGMGANSPVLTLQPLLKESSVLGLLAPTQVLTIYNPADSKNPTGFIGCGIEQ